MAGLPLITLPDFETLVLDRLFLCNSEILTTGKVFKLPPVNAQPPEAFPLCYALVGAMVSEIPVESIGAGVITVPRNYVVRVLGDPVPNTQDNTATGGAQGLINLVPYFSLFRQYYIGHPKLETTTLEALRYMSGQLLLLDAGFVERPAPGGTMHFAIDFTFTITMKAQVSTLA